MIVSIVDKSYQYEHISFSMDLLASLTVLVLCGVAVFAHFLVVPLISLREETKDFACMEISRLKIWLTRNRRLNHPNDSPRSLCIFSWHLRRAVSRSLAPRPRRRHPPLLRVHLSRFWRPNLRRHLFGYVVVRGDELCSFSVRIWFSSVTSWSETLLQHPRLNQQTLQLWSTVLTFELPF